MNLVQKNLSDSIQVHGKVIIEEGRAYNQRIDNEGNLLSYDFKPSRRIEKSNVICFNGLNFVLTRDWGIPMAIAIGNGSVSGADTPSSTDIELNSEIANGRFGVLGNRFTRVSSNIITLSAFWSRAQGYTAGVTEWGLFANEYGTSAIGESTGFLVARNAIAYTKSDSTKDVQIVWIITFTGS